MSNLVGGESYEIAKACDIPRIQTFDLTASRGPRVWQLPLPHGLAASRNAPICHEHCAGANPRLYTAPATPRESDRYPFHRFERNTGVRPERKMVSSRSR